jgi:hypothetical protein
VSSRGVPDKIDVVDSDLPSQAIENAIIAQFQTLRWEKINDSFVATVEMKFWLDKKTK